MLPKEVTVEDVKPTPGFFLNNSGAVPMGAPPPPFWLLSLGKKVALSESEVERGAASFVDFGYYDMGVG